jgi:hypothetical protein
MMKLAIFSVLAVLAATPVLAQSDSDKSQADINASSSTAVTPPAENPNVDSQTAASDTARQAEYKNKLDAAKAQSKIDSAKADRDASLAKADQARADKDTAEGKYPQ